MHFYTQFAKRVHPFEIAPVGAVISDMFYSVCLHNLLHLYDHNSLHILYLIFYCKLDNIHGVINFIYTTWIFFKQVHKYKLSNTCRVMALRSLHA